MSPDHPQTDQQPASPELHLRARVAVVTGASSGIGREVAIQLAAAGDHVVLVARRTDELQRTRELCGGLGRVQVCDVSDPAQVEQLAASVQAIEGRCDVLVNDAGVGAQVDVQHPDAMDAWTTVLSTNLDGAVRCTAALLPLLIESGPGAAIVNVSSIAGRLPLPGAAMYCSTKAALTSFSESLGAELAHLGVRVTCVQPGPVPTPGWPHERVMRSWWGRRLAADAPTVATRIVRLTHPGQPRTITVPRIWHAVFIMRAVVPGAYRSIMRSAARRRHAPTSGRRP